VKLKRITQVPTCEFHTVYDHVTRDLIRKAPCNSSCAVWAEAQRMSGLTRFLRHLMYRMSDAELKKASPAKAAKGYGISKEHAEGYIQLEREKRGLHV
jgi:hypothetical protein